MTYHIPLLVAAIVLGWLTFYALCGNTKTFDFDKIKQNRLTKKERATKRREKQKNPRQKASFFNERKQHGK